MWKKTIAWLFSSAPALFAVRFSKKIILPGFERMPLYDVAQFFVRGIQKGAVPLRASAVSFNFFLAIFPAVIFLFTLIPYIPIENFQERLLGLMEEFMPHNAYQATRDTIEDIVTNQRGGLLSVGFLAALYFSTNGFNALISAFNATHHALETRTPMQQRMVSFLLVVISALLLVAAITLIILSELVMNKIFAKGELSYYLIQSGRWISVFGLFYAMISFMYYLGPSRKSKWRFASAGSMFATVLIILTSMGFTYYVNHFGQYNKLYGSIGTLIVILLWLYFNSLVLILGFELNASIKKAKGGKP